MGLSYEEIVYQGRLLGGGDIWVLWAGKKMKYELREQAI